MSLVAVSLAVMRVACTSFPPSVVSRLMAGSVANSLLMTHPLFCRFKDRRIESAFAIYKANSSMSTLHLLMTIVLAILTVASLFIAPMFNIVVDRRSITRSTQIKISLMTFAIYGRRIYQLVRRRPMSYAGERANQAPVQCPGSC